MNSEEPQFLASEVFRETLLGFGIDEQTANNARKLFLAVKKDKFEETQMSFFKVAAEISNDGNSSSDKASSMPKLQADFSFMSKGHEENKEAKEED